MFVIPATQEAEPGGLQVQGKPGQLCLKTKTLKRVGNITQWQSICLAFIRPWVQSPVQHMKKENIIAYNCMSGGNKYNEENLSSKRNQIAFRLGEASLMR
jgi:hypothetical protein